MVCESSSSRLAWLALLATVVGTASVSSGARADGVGRPGELATCSQGTWIAVDFASGWEPAQRQAVLEHLSAGFDLYDVRVCPPQAAATDPLASIRVAKAASHNVNISVDVWDAVTRKRIGRDVDLTGYSEEAQALAIAVAIEELVRASWVELRLKQKSSTPSAEPPPPQVEQVVRDSVQVTPERHTRLGARAAAEAYSGGQVHFGPDLVFRQDLGARFAVGLVLGPRFAAPKAVDAGTLRARVFCGELIGDVRLHGSSGLVLELEAGLQGGSLVFEGETVATRRTAGGPTLVARSGLVLTLYLSEAFGVELGAGSGAVLVGAEATAEGTPVSAASGVEGHASLGLGVQL